MALHSHGGHVQRDRQQEGGGEWRGQGARLGLGLSKTMSEGEVAHRRETTRRSTLHGRHGAVHVLKSE